MKIIKLNTAESRPVKQAVIVDMIQHIHDRLQDTKLRFMKNNPAMYNFNGIIA